MSSRDKDFKEFFTQLLNFATEVVFRAEPIYSGHECHSSINEESIEAAKEKYHDLLLEYFDSIFGFDYLLKRSDWCRFVVERQGWLLDPVEIREKLFGSEILDE